MQILHFDSNKILAQLLESYDNESKPVEVCYLHSMPCCISSVSKSSLSDGKVNVEHFISARITHISP